MPLTTATDRVSKIANGIATGLDGTGLFKTGTTFEKRQWTAGLPGYMIWWSGFKAIGQSAEPSQSLVRANAEYRIAYTVWIAVTLTPNEQVAQEQLRNLTVKTLDALWNDKTLGVTAIRSAVIGGDVVVSAAKENPTLELPITVLADWAGAW